MATMPNQSIMLFLAALLMVLHSNLFPAQADELDIQYCYCRTPEYHFGWVKYFNYTSDRLGGANYLWNAKCAPVSEFAHDYEKCFGIYIYDWGGLRAEDYQHCNTFSSSPSSDPNNIEICTNGWSYSFDHHTVDLLPGQRYDRSTGMKEFFDHPDKTEVVVSDCTEDCRYAFPDLGGITGNCNFTDRLTGYEAPRTWDMGEVCRKNFYRGLTAL